MKNDRVDYWFMRSLKKAILPIFFLSFLSLVVVAQKERVSISGTVSLGSGITDLSGTSVTVRGSSNGVSTNNSGHYTISVEKPAVLVFSHVGYQSIDKEVGSETEIDVNLTLSANNLDQIVVVSYGTKKQRDITGSQARIDAAALRDVPAAEFGQKIQGRFAGVQINQTSGRPGQGMDFRIRGAASLSSGFQPLIVVDGQPLTGVNSRNGDANLINPDEIESFTVLKDASATALYGSRAANGVILITTKQAKSGVTNVSLNAYTGWQTVPQRGRPDLMNAREFATFMKGFYEDKAKYEGYTAGIPADYANPDQYGEGTDWYGQLLRTAPISDYSLNISSGTEKVSSSTTLSYFDQQGVLLNSGMKRYSLRSNNEFRPNDRVKLGLNIAPTYQLDHNTRQNTDGSRQILGNATTASPLIANRKADGTYNSRVSSFGMLGMNNPVQQLELLNGNQKTVRILSNLYADIEPVKNLHFRTSLNLDYGTAQYDQFFGTLYGIGLNAAAIPRAASAASATHSSYNYLSWLNENTLTYNLKVKDHSLDFLAGYSAQKWEREFRSISGSNYAGDAVSWISGAAITGGTNNKEAYSLASVFGRVNYDFKGRYLLTATIRQDGSSRFGENKKYGSFPSVSAGWIISDESFFPKNNVINFLKLRGSYGETGNFNIGNYLQSSNITSTNYVFGGTLTPGLSITTLGNRELTWEVSTQSDVGLEVNLLNNRLTFGYDYYNKITDGMLYPTSLPVASGYANIQFNVGKFKMWGQEFQLSSKNLTGKLRWNTDFNISFNDNKVLALPPNTPFIGGGPTYSGWNRSVVGRRIGEFYGYVFDGIYMTADELAKQPKYATSVVGSTRMKDIDGNGVVNADDRTLIGNPNPKYIFGLSNTFNYGNFDLNVIVSGQGGNQVLNANFGDYHNNDGVFNMTRDMINRWRSPTDQG
ncbi:MAG: SusC/RagA family TonB-linked outer membrane protein, partial [Chitinophagaceae bacterium]